MLNLLPNPTEIPGVLRKKANDGYQDSLGFLQALGDFKLPDGKSH